jgi:glucose/arabinose dehydrogenase
MKLATLALAVAVLTAACVPGEAGDGLTGIGAGLRGPAGMKAALYVTGLPNVAALAFDAQGRLWAATAGLSAGSSDGVYLVAKQDAAPVKVLSLETPLGLLWVGDTLYVASKGSVDAFSRLVGTSFANHSQIISFPAGVGELNGLVLSPDGRLLLGVSAPCDHCVPASAWSAAILAFRPDGSDLHVYAAGIRAPFGLAFYPDTRDLFVTMDQRDDLGSRTPGDWLALVEEGENWRFPDCYGQDGVSCTGAPSPLAVLDKHGAVAGLAFVGKAALVAEWSSGKVVRVELRKSGGGYDAAVHPFLSGIANPVAVVAAEDGAVLVGDWKSGTVYRVAGS